MVSKELKSLHEQIFSNGVVWALARLVDQHDQPTIAAQIYKDSGLGDKRLGLCEETDRAFLIRALEA